MRPYRKPIVAGHLHLNNPKQQILHFRAFICALFLSILLSFAQRATSQCVPPDLSFSNPKLISGFDGQVGAVYLFADVTSGVDATIEIIALNGGAGLGEIDNTTQGYFDAWQPYVTAGPLDTSSLDWKISFKVAGTDTDYFFPCLAVTAIDVDGDAAYLKEFIQAATPGAFAVDPFTWLSVNFDGVRTTAISTINNVPSIDTSARKAMFQMNFVNVNYIEYRNGAVSTKGSPDTRHTCIYFKEFFQNMVFLPVHLLSFQAKPVSGGTQVSWTATDEDDIYSYTLQASGDGKNWHDVASIPARRLPGVASYSAIDNNTAARSYYRLKYNNGKMVTYSKVIRVDNNAAVQPLSITCPTVIRGTTLPLQLTTAKGQNIEVVIATASGSILHKQRVWLDAGERALTLALPSYVTNGLYLLSVRDDNGQSAYVKKFIKQ